MTEGRSLELYFVSGDPDGMVVAEVFNWTGSVLKFPRTLAASALTRKECGRSGVYLLIGETDDGTALYVGEGDTVSLRLKQHMKEKDWWTDAVVISTAGDALNKAHIRYLESVLIEKAKTAGRASLDNGTAPPKPNLSEASAANLEAFLRQLDLVLPALGIGLFQPQTQQIKKTAAEMTAEPVAEFRVSILKDDIEANAVLQDGRFIVREGSTARPRFTRVSSQSTDSAQNMHADLLRTGILLPDQSHNRAVFTADTLFNSPSAAASVIIGRNSSGPEHWVHIATGQKYRDWEAARLDVAEPEEPA